MVAPVLSSSIFSAWDTKSMWQVRSRAKIATKNPYSTSLKPRRSSRALHLSQIVPGQRSPRRRETEGGAREGARVEVRCRALGANLARGACRASALRFS